MPADSVLQIKVTLADIRPPIWRRLQVPADLTLDRLHLVIQTAMGWENYHMHLFSTPAGD
ncbi:plasmid pRiA4b ORF-3 family protein, partial [Streptomyces lunaelactis]